MKRWIVIALLVLMIAVIGLCFAGCADHKVETNSGKTVIIDWQPVFDTDNISRITFFS